MRHLDPALARGVVRARGEQPLRDEPTDDSSTAFASVPGHDLGHARLPAGVLGALAGLGRAQEQLLRDALASVASSA